MKIGFPVLKKDLIEDLTLDQNLHSSNYFCVYNPSDKSFKILLTESMYDNGGGMGLIHFLKAENIGTIISPECHPMAAKFFQDNYIGTFKAIGNNVNENLQKYTAGELEPFNENTIVQKKSCSSDCSSCSSTCEEEVQELVQI